MKNKTKDQLIYEWKQIRANFFNLLREDEKKFEQNYDKHPLYHSVKKHFDKSFRDVNQIATKEIDIFLNSSEKKIL